MLKLDKNVESDIERILDLDKGCLAECSLDRAWELYDDLCDLEVEYSLKEDNTVDAIAFLVDEFYSALENF